MKKDKRSSVWKERDEGEKGKKEKGERKIKGARFGRKEMRGRRRRRRREEEREEELQGAW